jgi:sec-independent protein translocase protein TatA
MNVTLAVLGLSGTELMVVLVAVLVLFGAKRIPEFAKGLGKGINEFKKASREVTDEIERSANEPPPPSAPRPAAPTVATSNQSASEPSAAPKS